jgi:hypothetical protein
VARRKPPALAGCETVGEEEWKTMIIDDKDPEPDFVNIRCPYCGFVLDRCDESAIHTFEICQKNIRMVQDDIAFDRFRDNKREQ